MKKLSLVLGLVLLAAAAPMLAQNTNSVSGAYFDTYYSNNISPLVADQVVRAINVGALGVTINNPESGLGDICENVIVFDSNQEMIACCACRLTPNELSSAFGQRYAWNLQLLGGFQRPVGGRTAVYSECEIGNSCSLFLWNSLLERSAAHPGYCAPAGRPLRS